MKVWNSKKYKFKQNLALIFILRQLKMAVSFSCCRFYCQRWQLKFPAVIGTLDLFTPVKIKKTFVYLDFLNIRITTAICIAFVLLKTRIYLLLRLKIVYTITLLQTKAHVCLPFQPKAKIFTSTQIFDQIWLENWINRFFTTPFQFGTHEEEKTTMKNELCQHCSNLLKAKNVNTFPRPLVSFFLCFTGWYAVIYILYFIHIYHNSLFPRDWRNY